MKLLVGYLSRFFAFIVVHLPIKIQNLLGDLIGILWLDILRIRRKIVLENLKIAFPNLSKKEAVKLAQKSLRNMGRNVIEFCHFPYLTKENIDEKYNYVGLENLDKALLQDKGVCLLSLHMGNGDFAGAAFSLKGYKIHLISKEFNVKWLNSLWFGIRGRLGTKFISPRNSSYAVLRALRAKEIVVFVLDQFMGPPIGVETTFFGRKTGTAMGLTVMTKRTGAPVVLCYDLRNEDGTHTLTVGAPIPFEEKETKEATLSHMTQVYTNHIEEVVRNHPEQWMWVHRRWKKFKK